MSELGPGEWKTPSGIEVHVHWGWASDGSFRVTGQDFKPNGSEYEYIATVPPEALPALASALGTDLEGIEPAWSARIDEINHPGFVSWLRGHGVEYRLFTWHDGDWF